jgi:UDP-N-acetylmuramoyl-L-alanyl-D-glutamate--2,6-diaminopimelate ligase
MLDLSSLTKGLEVRVIRGDASARIADITEDSRRVRPGAMFIARKGHAVDGREHIPAALAAGCAAVLTDDPDVPWPAERAQLALGQAAPTLLVTDELASVGAIIAERFFASPSSALRLLGVTGTNGKTTIAYLTQQLVRAAGVRCGMIGTVCIDDGATVTPAALTTPPAIELSRTLARMVARGCGACVMETSSHSLDQGRVAGLSYAAAAFTNLSHDHLDYHHSMESYAAAKARLFAMLPASGLAVVNIDDPWHARMLRDCKAPVVACSLGPAPERSAWPSGTVAHVRAVIVGTTASTTRVTLFVTSPTHGLPAMAPTAKHSLGARVALATSVWDSTVIELPLVGPHNALNALQAGVLALAATVDDGPRALDAAVAIVGAMACVKAPPGRLEPVTPADAPVHAYVDYAHSDDSLARVLDVLRAALTGSHTARLICVMGCGGDRDRSKRPVMGATSAAKADLTVITSDNPRTEDPGEIIAQIVAGVAPELRGRVLVEPDRARAIALAVEKCRPGDVLLVAGKGHEDYQIVLDERSRGQTHLRTVKLHFDDREVTRAALDQHGWPVRPPTLEAQPQRATTP